MSLKTAWLIDNYSQFFSAALLHDAGGLWRMGAVLILRLDTNKHPGLSTVPNQRNGTLKDA